MTNRRNFLKKSLPLASLPLAPLSSLAMPTEDRKNTPGIRPKVIFFDVNETLLDLEPLKRSVVEKLGGRKDLGALWFATMLHYSLVSTVGNQYHDFGKIGGAALRMVGANAGIHLSEAEAMAVIKPILSLDAHPDVKQGLKLLKDAGFTLVSFTNSSNNAVKQQLEHAGLTQYFDASISVEDYGKFKPDEQVYHWAARKMKAKDEECLLVAAHGWDTAGALWAGWQAAFIARPGQQLFPLAPPPHYNVPELVTLAKEIAGHVK